LKVQLKGRVLEIFEGKNQVFATMNDTEEGGSVKLGFPPGTVVAVDALLNINATIKPGIGQYGQFLKVTKLNPDGGK